jgi:flagellar biosynthesis/type III secretory pathway protein FliH
VGLLYQDLTRQNKLTPSGKLSPVLPVLYNGEELWRQEGLEEGLERGLGQGREQGTRRMLARQIVKKYGTIPAWAQTRLDQADTEQLETWADAILEAETLEALLSEVPRH